MADTLIQRVNNWLPAVTIAGSVCFSTIGAVWYLSSQKTLLEQRVDTVESQMIDLAAAIQDDRYTLTMAAERALRTAIENPGMRVPDPRDPSTVIVVTPKN